MCQRDHKVLSHQTSGGTAGLDEGYPGHVVVCSAWLLSHMKTSGAVPHPQHHSHGWISVAQNLSLTSSKKGDSWSGRISSTNMRSREGLPFLLQPWVESAGKQEKWSHFPTFTDDWNRFKLARLRAFISTPLLQFLFFLSLNMFCPTCTWPSHAAFVFHNNKVHESLIKQKAASTLASVMLSAMR